VPSRQARADDAHLGSCSIRLDAPDTPPLRGDVLTGCRVPRVHREMQLAVGFTG